MNSKPKTKEKKHKFRSVETLMVDRFNFFSSQKKMKMNEGSSLVKDAGIHCIPPVSGLDSSTINFIVKADEFSSITFLEHYNLIGEIDFEVTYAKHENEDLSDEATRVTEDFLSPQKHKFCLPTSTGLLSLFKRIEVSFETFTDSLSNLNTGDVNWLNKIACLENSFQSRTNKASEFAQFGLAPGFNRNINDLTNLLGDPGAELWPHDQTEKGSRFFYGKISQFPFRLYAPWQNSRIEKNLGSNMVPECGGIIPPKTELHLKLEKDNIPFLFRCTSLMQDHEIVANPEKTNDSSWKNFTIIEGDKKKKSFV